MRRLRWIACTAALGAMVLPGIAPAGAATAQAVTSFHWGDADLSDTPVATPTAVSGLPSNITAFSSGFDYGPGQFNLALTSTGVVYAWGENRFGVLGNGTTTADDTPTAISGLPAITSIASGGNWSVAVDASGHLWTWGHGAQGEMADGTYNSYSTPHEVPGVSGVAGVAAGGGGGVAYLTNGSVLTWGRNTMGQLGNGKITQNSNVPVQVPGLSHVVQVSHSWQTASAVDSSGRVWIWGFTGFGERGDGTSPQATPSPVAVALPRPATEASVGGNAGTNGHVLALLNNGTVWAWGDDAIGQVGNGTEQSQVTTPTEVPMGAPVAWIGAGGDFSVALTTSGSVATWGQNADGQLGDGKTTDSDTAVTVNDLPPGATVLGVGEASVDALG